MSLGVISVAALSGITIGLAALLIVSWLFFLALVFRGWRQRKHMRHQFEEGQEILTRDRKALVSEERALTERLKILETEVARETREHDVYMRRRERIRRERVEGEKEVARLRREYDQLKQDGSDIEDDVQRLKAALAERNRLMTELEQRQQEYYRRDSELESRAEELDARERALDERRAELDRLATQVKAMEQAKGSLTNTISRLEGELEELGGSRQSLAGRIKEEKAVFAELERLQERTREIRGELENIDVNHRVREADENMRICLSCNSRFPAERQYYQPRGTAVVGRHRALFSEVPPIESVPAGDWGSVFLTSAEVDAWLERSDVQDYCDWNVPGWRELSVERRRELFFWPRCWFERCREAVEWQDSMVPLKGGCVRVAIVGAPGAGKTVLLLTLLRQLVGGVLSRYGLHVDFHPDHPFDRWADAIRDLAAGVLPGSTCGSCNDALLTVSDRDDRVLTNLFFRDIGGEEWEHMNEREITSTSRFPFVQHADLILFLIDPMASPGFRHAIREGVAAQPPRGRSSVAPEDTMFARMRHFLKSFGSPRQQERACLFFVLTKLDELRDNCPEVLGAEHFKQLAARGGGDVYTDWDHAANSFSDFLLRTRVLSEELRQRLAALSGYNTIVHNRGATFDNITYFAVSALGGAPASGPTPPTDIGQAAAAARVVPRGVHAIGVVDPLVYGLRCLQVLSE